MPGIVTASAGGSGPLAKVTAVPFPRANCGVRGFIVEAMDGNPGTVRASTTFRLGTSGLLAPDTSGTRFYRGAVRDTNGLWSEWSPVQDYTQGAYVAGGTEGSIGSGVIADNLIQSPGVEFPDLSKGSGMVKIFRTLVSPGFGDEVRNPAWPRDIASFSCIFTDLDAWQVGMLHRFWRGLNGPLMPFFFDWADPSLNSDGSKVPRLSVGSKRYIVRFRDAAIVSKLFSVDRSAMDFTLVEQMDAPEGGDV